MSAQWAANQKLAAEQVEALRREAEDKQAQLRFLALNPCVVFTIKPEQLYTLNWLSTHTYLRISCGYGVNDARAIAGTHNRIFPHTRADSTREVEQLRDRAAQEMEKLRSELNIQIDRVRHNALDQVVGDGLEEELEGRLRCMFNQR